MSCMLLSSHLCNHNSCLYRCLYSLQVRMPPCIWNSSPIEIFITSTPYESLESLWLLLEAVVLYVLGLSADLYALVWYRPFQCLESHSSIHTFTTLQTFGLGNVALAFLFSAFDCSCWQVHHIFRHCFLDYALGSKGKAGEDDVILWTWSACSVYCIHEWTAWNVM